MSVIGEHKESMHFMQTWLFRWTIQRSSFKWETHHKFILVQVRRPTMNWYNKYNLRSEAGILDDLKGSSDALMFWNKQKKNYEWLCSAMLWHNEIWFLEQCCRYIIMNESVISDTVHQCAWNKCFLICLFHSAPLVFLFFHSDSFSQFL